MIEIVNFWENLIESYDSENRCGFGWNYFNPITEKKLNVIRTDCQVNVFTLFQQRPFKSSRNVYRDGYISETFETKSYEVLFLISSNEGLNNYNEFPEHPKSESRTKTIYEPLENCINIDMLNSICDYVYEISNWSLDVEHDYQDGQFYGYKLRITQINRK